MATAVEDDLGWIFRPKRRTDVGVDGEIEIARGGQATGSLISVQVKCGESYLDEKLGDGFVYRGDLAHLRYWIDHSIPVIVVLCNPASGDCYWAEVTAANATLLTKGWKITVPFENKLSESEWRLEGLTKQASLEDVVELAIIRWLHDKHPKRVEVCSLLPLPRDWNYGALLTEIDDRPTAVYPIFDRYGAFDEAKIDSAISGFESVERDYGVRDLIVCLVSQTPSAFRFNESIKASLMTLRPNMQTVRFLFSLPYFLNEIDADDQVIEDYERGEPLKFGRSLFD